MSGGVLLIEQIHQIKKLTSSWFVNKKLLGMPRQRKLLNLVNCLYIYHHGNDTESINQFNIGEYLFIEFWSISILYHNISWKFTTTHRWTFDVQLQSNRFHWTHVCYQTFCTWSRMSHTLRDSYMNSTQPLEIIHLEF